MASEDEVISVLEVLSAAYPTFNLRPGTVRVYVALLADVPAEVLAGASIQHMAESKFFPAVAELREMALRLGRQDKDDPGGLEAWRQVLDEVRRGVGHPQVFKSTTITDRKILDSVACVGGWRMLATSTDSEDIAHRARFVEAYNRYAERERQAAQMMPNVRAVIEATRLRLDAGARRLEMDVMAHRRARDDPSKHSRGAGTEGDVPGKETAHQRFEGVDRP